MKVYRLNCAPPESGSEGEDHDEYFSSLAAAKARRAELIAQDPALHDHRYGRDFKIERLDITDDLPRRALVLALLNRRGYVTKDSMVEVVPDYEPRTRHEETSE